MEINKIYHGDCRQLIKQLDDKSVDLCLTDFPYGIGEEYKSFSDTQENLKPLVDEIMPEILRVSKRTAITCGVKNIFLFPKPDWISAWYIPSGVGRSSHGFCCWQPILNYGNCPTNHKGSASDVFKHIETSEKNGHPCPKPIKIWSKLLHKYTLNEDELVLDPFMGSGTTAVACIKYKRNYIGFEIEKDYVDIANKRIELQHSKPELF